VLPLHTAILEDDTDLRIPPPDGVADGHPALPQFLRNLDYRDVADDVKGARQQPAGRGRDLNDILVTPDGHESFLELSFLRGKAEVHVFSGREENRVVLVGDPNLFQQHAAFEEGPPNFLRAFSRNDVEDGRTILEAAAKQKVAFLVVGDPMAATTHVDLRLRAAAAKIPTRIVHGVSILTAAAGALGLQVYKFGRTTTVPFPAAGFGPTSPLEGILENRRTGLHSPGRLTTSERSPSRVPGSGLFARTSPRGRRIGNSPCLPIAAGGASSLPDESAPGRPTDPSTHDPQTPSGWCRRAPSHGTDPPESPYPVSRGWEDRVRGSPDDDTRSLLRAGGRRSRAGSNRPAAIARSR